MITDDNVEQNPFDRIGERLTAYADAEQALGTYTQAKCLYAASAYIKRLETIIRHLRPENNQNLFICGIQGRYDDIGMPDRIEVCPTYGASTSFIYERVKDDQVTRHR